ncbi:MAG: hypothetical protein ABR906_14035 [Terracidiphilus sp.]
MKTAVLMAALGAAAQAQDGLISAPEPKIPLPAQVLPDRLADMPSQPPAFAIPVEPLGFSAPGLLYFGLNNSFVSLDFLDENRLLFTFRVPGLIRRGTAEAGDATREASSYDERQIRAVVLALPAGTVEDEALWTVHDRARYLWMLSGGRFLLRDRDNLLQGDATLELKPFLHFAGPLLYLEMDPMQQFLVADSREPAEAAQYPTDHSKSPRTPAANSDLAVRILRRDSGQVMLVSRSRSTVHLPINADGYLESLRGSGGNWLLNLNYFNGGSAILGQIDSSCAPLFDFLSEQELLATICTPLGAGKLVAMGTDGRRLWQAQTSDAAVWPLVVRALDGSRLAREAVAVTHPVHGNASITQDEIKGQLVEVLDAANGRVVLETRASPILDAGGNVALSPSGRRVAVLNAGAIQVFELALPPTLPSSVRLAPAIHPPDL